MNINKNIFQANPTRLDISRSKFDLSHGWKGTFNTGLLIPVYLQEVLPGDTFKLDASCVIRSTTPVAPVMDDAFADLFFFYVRNDKILSRQSMSPSVDDSNHSWKAFIGAQDNFLNMPLPSDVTLPSICFGSLEADTGKETDFERGSLADYLGLPDFPGKYAVNYFKRRINCLAPLAYYSVWSEFFRDENTMNPVTYRVLTDGLFGETAPRIEFSGGTENWTDRGRIGLVDSILPVCRFHGYFGSALPWPQRNSTTVELPLGDTAPLVADSSVYSVGRTIKFGSSEQLAELLANDGTNWTTSASSPDLYASGTNLKVDLSQATAASVNALRASVQLQRWYEASARGGNRDVEMVASMFGVTPADNTTDRPEYLGGKRIRINIQQVENTAGTNESTATQQAIGSTGAYSLTTDDSGYFTKSFDYWGQIIGVVCIRTKESFHQGLPKMFTRFDRFSFFWPVFANLGEEPIESKQIYMDGTAGDSSVFGYQEAWAEYRFHPDVTTGLARPGSNQAYWTYTNNFESRPTLPDYLNASGQKAIVDRTLQVPSTTAGFQWLADFHFDVTAVRPMPTHSIPGLVDHH